MPKDDKRDRILAAATAVFAQRDFHRVHMSEVATRAGVGKGTVYLYFPTKDDLHTATLQGSLQQLASDVDAAAASDAPVERVLRDIVLVILRFFWTQQHLLTLVQRHERRNTRRHRVIRAIERVLARHRVAMPGVSPHLAAGLLLGLTRAAILERAAGDRAPSTATRVVACYLHGMPQGAPRVRKGAR